MKRYVIALISLMICCTIIVLFSIPDRIQYAFNGMAGYNVDRYEEYVADLPSCTLDIDFSTYKKQPYTVCKYNDDVYLDLVSIVFNGDSYTFNFISYGSSTFSTGNIICLEQNCEDLYINNDLGEFVFQFTGVDALENDAMNYCFALYPNFENCSTNDFATMSISIPLDNLTLMTYERMK